MTELPRGSAAEELVAVAHAWDRAMITNDPEAIGRFMADDWVIIGSDGSLGGKARFLGLVETGALTHSVMTSEDLSVRIYGSTAVVTSRGVSGGRYQGQPFREVERVSCVFVKDGTDWKCVLTHLSKLAEG
jgi:ketosteroid isomerase-like protein